MRHKTVLLFCDYFLFKVLFLIKKKLMFFRKLKGIGKIQNSSTFTITPRSSAGDDYFGLLPAAQGYTQSQYFPHLCCQEHFPKQDYFDLDI